MDALILSYIDWGGKSHRPQMAIVDWKEVPTWSEFEILKARFEKMGVPVVLADPRELEFDGRRLAAKGKKIDLVYRRVLINDIVARPKECEALGEGVFVWSGLRGQQFPLQDSARKSVLRRADGSEKSPSCFLPEEQEVIRQHVPWTRVVEDVRSDYNGESIEFLNYIRKNREQLVLKPSDEYGGMGVTLGWEAGAKSWDNSLQQAMPGGKLADAHGCWIVQERIPISRREFPTIGTGGKVKFQNMLVDFAPYLFRGKMAGFLTRLSSSGLANVTSGGGQIPSFRVTPKKWRTEG